MRILGIDCGLQRTGYGAISSDGRNHSFIAAGVIRTRQKDSLAVRLREIHHGLRDLVKDHQPQAVAVEAVFSNVNVGSALKLAHVRGVALLAAAEAGLPVGEYSPLEVKSGVVGYGRADKSQVRTMVCSLLGLTDPISSFDASDALAVAICHANLAHSEMVRGAVRGVHG